MLSGVDSKILIAFSAYVIAWVINDATARSIGGIPATASEFAVLGGLAVALQTPGQLRRSQIWDSLVLPLTLYFGVTAIWAIVGYFRSGSVDFRIASMIANMLWFTMVGRRLTLGITSKQLNFICNLLIVLAVGAACLGGLEMALGRPLFTSGVMAKGTLEGSMIARGTFQDKTDFAACLALGFFAAIGSLVSGQVTHLRRVYLGLVLGFLSIILIFSRSTTGMIGIAAGLIATLPMLLREWRNRFMVIVLCGMVAVGAQFLNFSEQAEYFQLKYERQVSQYQEYNYRYLALVECLKGFTESPIVGAGWETAPQQMQERLGMPKPIVPHTIFATILFEQGLIGIIPFIWICFAAWRIALRVYRMKTVPIWLRVVVVGFSAFMLVRFCGYYFYLDRADFFIWLTLLCVAAEMPGAETVRLARSAVRRRLRGVQSYAS